jgi:CelD/BcsL family acetyltransferase involved in cellulose biosynthesis
MNEIQSAVAAAHGWRGTQPTARPCAQVQSEALPGAHIAVHSDLDAVDSLWREFERRAIRTVFQGVDYLGAWHRQIGTQEQSRPAIVVIESRSGVQAILPLAVEGRGPVRRLTWFGQNLCDYLAPLMSEEFARITPERFRALWSEIGKVLQSDPRFRHDWVELRRMPVSVEKRPNPFTALNSVRHPSPSHFASLTADWENFYRERRTSKARKQDRSKLARLSELGEVSLFEPHEPAEIARTLETLFAQKADALQRKGIADLFELPGRREFFLDLAANPRMREIVHVSALAVGPSLAAVALGMEYRGRYSLFMVSYDRAFAKLSPGVIHLNKLLERAIGRGLTEFDFLVGEQRLKLEWTDAEIELLDHVSATTLRGMVPALTARMLTHAKRTIKQTPWLWSAFQKLRSTVGSLRNGGKA